MKILFINLPYYGHVIPTLDKSECLNWNEVLNESRN